MQLSQELTTAFGSDDARQLGALIRRRRPADFEALLDLLADADAPSNYRVKALAALGRWNDQRAVSAVRERLPELNEAERIAAIDALGRLGSSEAEAVVAEYAGDDSPQVRKFVVLALRRLGTAGARATLVRMAQDDPQPWVRDLAVGRPR